MKKALLIIVLHAIIGSLYLLNPTDSFSVLENCGKIDDSWGWDTCQKCAASVCTPVDPFVKCNDGAGTCCQLQEYCPNYASPTPEPPPPTRTPAPTATPGPEPTVTQVPTPHTRCGIVGNMCCLPPVHPPCEPGAHCDGPPNGTSKCASGSPTPLPSDVPTLPPLCQYPGCNYASDCNTSNGETCEADTGAPKFGSCLGICETCDATGCHNITSTPKPISGTINPDDPNFNDPMDPPLPAFDMCQFALDSNCSSCVGKEGVWTGIGCIPSETVKALTAFFTLAVSLGAGAAFLVMLVGVLTIITASGNPDKMTAGQQTITGAVIGLLFIILSVTLLRLIGVVIIQIPGF